MAEEANDAVSTAAAQGPDAPVRARLASGAADPRIIPGVHHHCDEWCDYCGISARCLEFRCTAEYRRILGRRAGEPTFFSLDEAVGFTRDLAAVEGTTTDELDALLSHAPGTSEIRTADPLASLAWEYAVRAALTIGPGAIQAIALTPLAAGPPAREVVAWYHLRIYMRVFRALVAGERGRANGGSTEEALGSAKLAIVSIARSRTAWRTLADEHEAAAIAELVALLDAIERGLDERFPKAREFVRLGLDVPVS